MIEFIVAFTATAASLPFVARLLRRLQMIDRPNERSSHTYAALRGGGLACAFGALSGFVAGQASEPHSADWRLLAVVGVVALVGFLDDLRTLPALARLAVQLAAGALAGWLVAGDVASVGLGLLLIPATVNVVNFMDGINGITGLTASVWGTTAMIIGHGQHQAIFVLGAVTTAISIAFLPMNLPAGRMFIGDTGSYLIGSLVAVTVLVASRIDNQTAIVLTAPLAIYIADTGITLVRRAWRKAPLMSAHREHTYQRLVHQSELSHTTVAVLCAGLASLCSACWIVFRPAIAGPITAVICIMYVLSPPIVRAARGPRHVAPGSSGEFRSPR